MKQNEKDSRITDVSFEDGQVIRAIYLIGADGAHSIIRTIASIGFSDPEGPNLDNNILAQMVSADVTFEPEPVGPLTLKGHLNGSFFRRFLHAHTVRQPLQCRTDARENPLRKLFSLWVVPYL
ncbi:hypothetical protein BDR05DRAFT_1046133 [Suillus weaverae]|nr:hypothetical protein BDR05DRAFT_1046133 [Suillus weaverae]